MTAVPQPPTSTVRSFRLGHEPPIRGKYATLEPCSRDQATKFIANTQVAGNSELFKYLPRGTPASGDEFLDGLIDYFGPEGYVLYAITADPSHVNPSTTASNQSESRDIIGVIGYLDISRTFRSVEVGFVIFTTKLQRTVAATEAHYLVLKNVCEARETDADLPYRRIAWKCNSQNLASRRAAERLGFTYEGTCRNHMIFGDVSRDSDILSIIDTEWPLVKAALEAWLDDGNFDTQGRQVKSVSQLRFELSSSPQQ